MKRNPVSEGDGGGVRVKKSRFTEQDNKSAHRILDPGISETKDLRWL